MSSGNVGSVHYFVHDNLQRLAPADIIEMPEDLIRDIQDFYRNQNLEDGRVWRLATRLAMRMMRKDPLAQGANVRVFLGAAVKIEFPPAVPVHFQSEAWIQSFRWVLPKPLRETMCGDLLERRARLRGMGLHEREVNWDTGREIAVVVARRLGTILWSLMKWAGVLGAAECVRQCARQMWSE